ncbi:MAG: sulfite exporter TauE/SafE family protein, partial [Candidatus Limnocylindria bacterium]
FHYPLGVAVGTSLICVIATSSGAAAHYVRSGRADVRLGITLEVATALGGIAGGLIAGVLLDEVIAGLFAALMYYTAFSLARARAPEGEALAASAGIEAEAAAPSGGPAPAYRTHRLPAALVGSFVAGNLSALLGVGGGVVKVPIIHLVMGAPMPVAIATSNFIIGVTASAGAVFYLFRGDVDPTVAGPVVLGVFGGAFIGSRVASRIRPRLLRLVFVVIVLYVAVQMTLRALEPLGIGGSA